MRVRPFFWIFLLLACGGILAFAATYSPSAPAILQIHIANIPGPSAMTVINLHATDLDGVPLDGIQLLPQANMTNMSMTTQQIYTTPQGQGNYLLRLRLYMVGPWAVTIAMQAQGFAPLKRTIFVQVQPTNGSACTVKKPIVAS